MTELAFHPNTQLQLETLVAARPHAVLLSGAPGSGKASVAAWLAAASLKLAPGKLEQYPYLRIIRPQDTKAIPIEVVRELEHFLSLQVPSVKVLNRVVIIEDSHLLSLEAQNALLKTLEEPPQATLIIMTVAHEQALLPTIRSRMQAVTVLQPSEAALKEHFLSTGATSEQISKAYALSSGLPGLTHSLLNEADHPLKEAAMLARSLLGQTVYERILSVDELSKQKGLAQNVCFILQQMAHISLQSASGATTKRWQNILQAAYQASEAYLSSGQPRLILLNLMVGLG